MAGWRKRLAALLGGAAARLDGTRRWEASETSRLNADRWSRAQPQPINLDLMTRLPVLRQRCIQEAANNPYLAGAIDRYVCSIVGDAGPQLQVHVDPDGQRRPGRLTGDARAYAKALENVWWDWSRTADLHGGSLTDLLMLWWRTVAVQGEYLAQVVSAGPDAGPVGMRLLTIDPGRLATPTDRIGRPEIVMGVEYARAGTPVAYYIEDRPPGGLALPALWNYTRVRARNIVHGFLPVEADQARGVPLLASVLETAGELRDYDAQVLDAARAAADYAVYYKTQDPTIEPLAVDGDEVAEIQRRTVRFCPPGWEPAQMTPQQPSTSYVEFRDERLREIGQVFGMPLMMLKLDSSGHNYSSARFDDQLHRREVQRLRAWQERHTLDRLLREVMREAELSEALPTAPAGVWWTWTWPKAPHVDPQKEAMAERLRLGNRTLTLAEACAAHGQDWEAVLDQLAAERERMEALGLPEPEQSGTPQNADSGDEAGTQERPGRPGRPAVSGNGTARP